MLPRVPSLPLLSWVLHPEGSPVSEPPPKGSDSSRRAEARGDGVLPPYSPSPPCHVLTPTAQSIQLPSCPHPQRLLLLPAWSWWWAQLGPVSGTWEAYWKGLDPLTPQVTPFPEPSLGEPGRWPPQALAKDTEDARPQSEAPQWAPPGTQHPIKPPGGSGWCRQWPVRGSQDQGPHLDLR